MNIFEQLDELDKIELGHTHDFAFVMPNKNTGQNTTLYPRYISTNELNELNELDKIDIMYEYVISEGSKTRTVWSDMAGLKFL